MLVVDYRKEAPAFEYGDGYCLTRPLQEPKGASNPGEFDFAAYLDRKGISATVGIWDGGWISKIGGNSAAGVSGSATSLTGGGNPTVKAAFGTKHSLEGVLRKTLPERHASLLAGLLFGSRGNPRTGCNLSRTERTS